MEDRKVLLSVKDLIVKFHVRGRVLTAIRGVSLDIYENESIAIVGESGSGKTTLLNLLATLDTPTEGTILLNGKDVSILKEAQAADFRREHLGFVFQEFNLLDTFSLRDNIYLPLVLSGKKHSEFAKRLNPIAKQLHIEKILDKFPYEVSGGQKQRAAVARALITHPDILLADEPTGNLDPKNSLEIMKLLEEINERGTTVLVVTHNQEIVNEMKKRVITMKKGVIVSDEQEGGYKHED